MESVKKHRQRNKELRGQLLLKGVVNNEIGRYLYVYNGHLGSFSDGSYFLSSPATGARWLPPASGFCKIPYLVILPAVIGCIFVAVNHLLDNYTIQNNCVQNMAIF
jgi:hypothetical protein